MVDVCRALGDVEMVIPRGSAALTYLSIKFLCLRMR